MIQKGGRKAKIPMVGVEAECMIRCNRVEALVLQAVGLKLCHQSDAPPLLMLIDQKTASVLANGPHREFQLISTVAAKRSKHVAREALRVNAQERGLGRRIAKDEYDRCFNPRAAVVGLSLEAEHLKDAPLGR